MDQAVTKPKRTKVAGRTKGTPNKVTADVRAAIALIAQGSIEDFKTWMLQIDDPGKRCDVFLKLLSYHVPQLSRVDGQVRVVRSTQDMTDDELAAIAYATPAPADGAGAPGPDSRTH